MKIRIKVNQAPCAHQYLTLKGIDLKRSTERYTCNACGDSVVRTLKASVSYWLAPHYHATVTKPSDTGN